MKKVITTFIMLLLMLTLSAITLDESIELAKENNKELLAEKSAFSSSDWGKKNAFTNFLPKISFNTTVLRIDNETYDSATEIKYIPVLDQDGNPIGSMPFSTAAMSSGFYKTSFQNNIIIQQPIFNGGKLIIGYQLSKLEKEQALFTLQDKENDIIFQVASTYFNILKIQELLKLTEKSIESSKRHLVKVQENIKVGFAKESDILQWQLKLQNEKTTLFEVKNNLKILTVLWQDLIGTENKDHFPTKIDINVYDLEIKRFSNMDEAQIEKAIADFSRQIEQENIVLKSFKITNEMLQKKLLMAKGNFLPSLNLQYTYQFENDDQLNFSGDDNWSLVAAFSLPIFSGGTNYTNLQKVRYENRKTALYLESTKDKILSGAKKTFYDQITKAQTIENNKSALNYARENQRLINNLYDQGMITNNDLLDADEMGFVSEINLISSYYDYLIIKYEIKKYTD